MNESSGGREVGAQAGARSWSLAASRGSLASEPMAKAGLCGR